MPVNVLHIIKSLGRGGAEMLLPETLSKHDQQKFRFHYIYFLPWKDQMVSEIEKQGGIVHCFSANNNIQILLSAKKIAAYIRKHDIKLIHCHMPWAGIVGRLAGRMTNTPVVYTEHNMWERYHKLTYYANKLSWSLQQKVIAVSADVKESIRKRYRKPKPDVEVVLNGVNTDKFSRSIPVDRNIRQELGIDDQKKIIGLICVFRPQKRLLDWLEIASGLHQKHPETFFILIGDGVLKPEVTQRAEELDMKSYLHFAGLQTEVRPYLKAMDIFMMSSEFEGLPIALLEAMSMECIPACTDAGGIGEVVKDNVNGLLVPVADPNLLEGKISGLLNDWEGVNKLREEARRTVKEHFSMERMVANLEHIYDEVLNKK